MKLLSKRLGKVGAAIVVLLLVAEALARFKMYYRTRDSTYLTGRFSRAAPVGKPAPAVQGTPLQAAPTQNFGDQNSWYYKMAPRAPVPAASGAKDDFRINSLGFRGPEFSRDKTPGVTRIFCIGDSNTVGLEAREDDTWPATLARLLGRQAGSQFEVINAGFNGYTSFNYLMLIREELLEYSPDVFVIYGGVNDLNQQSSLRPKENWGTRVHDFLYNRSIFYTLAIEKVSLLRSGSPVPVVAYEKWDDEEFVHNTTAIIGLCRRKQVRLVFVREMIDDEAADPDLRVRMHQEMNALQHLCVKHGVEYLDLSAPFLEARRAGRPLFRDPMHLNTNGYGVLAEKVSAVLIAPR
jgi:lysophospholipase L1-like esterase